MNNKQDKKRNFCGRAEKIRESNKKKLALDAGKCLKINDVFKNVMCKTLLSNSSNDVVSYTK